MAKQLNPLQKEFLILRYRKSVGVKLTDFCKANGVSTSSFTRWKTLYNNGGLDALARADSTIKSILPEGVDPTEEAYRREILKLRIELERLKKNYVAQKGPDGKMEYRRLKPKISK